MGLVHDQNEVVETGEVIEVRLPEEFGEAPDLAGIGSADVELRDVEDVDDDVVALEQVEHLRLLLEVLAGDDRRRLHGELRNALEDVL